MGTRVAGSIKQSQNTPHKRGSELKVHGTIMEWSDHPHRARCQINILQGFGVQGGTLQEDKLDILQTVQQALTGHLVSTRVAGSIKNTPQKRGYLTFVRKQCA